ncbi:MAG: DUF4834 family protein [Bacteroidaceae bacterium]|nr:DUF4834 family protein [Bacteroidaceae bacterium]
MLEILLIILLLFFILIFGVGAFFFAFLRRIFGGTGVKSGFNSGGFRSASNSDSGTHKENAAKKSGAPKNKNKIFSSDEGTYVDFIEVKE